MVELDMEPVEGEQEEQPEFEDLEGSALLVMFRRFNHCSEIYMLTPNNFCILQLFCEKCKQDCY